jgi:hypothetical protein
MANVLPQQSQKKLWRALRARFIVVLSVLLILLAILGYLALIPSQLALQFAAPPASAPTPAAAAPAESTASISRTQAILLALSPMLAASTTPSSLITEALSPKPVGISIDRVSYDASDGTVMLSGSGTRDAINTYRDLVAQNVRFSSVSVPVSALVGESGHFSMTITLAQH